MTLYMFVPDNQGPSTCVGECLAAWPALAGPATAGDGVDASKLGTAARPDGTQQATYGGWPLYTFIQDAAPGDVNGQDSGEKWYVIGADGVPIKELTDRRADPATSERDGSTRRAPLVVDRRRSAGQAPLASPAGMATLRFSFGTMGSGKSTFALQIHHNLSSRDLYGLLLTCLDREGDQVTSRLGVAAPAIDVTPDIDLHRLCVRHWPIHYLVCDEAQFYTVKQCDQLARVVDELEVEVYAFGLITDFRGHLFDGTRAAAGDRRRAGAAAGRGRAAGAGRGRRTTPASSTAR